MAEAGMLATVALLLSAVGGWVTGMLSDRYGRVRILQWTILWFAFFTFLSGFTQNFNQLFICRALQGLGFGGEWAAGAVLIGETIRDRYRGRAVGTVQSGWAIGWAAATILFWGVFSVLPEELAWRVMFWFGLAPGAAGLLRPALRAGAGVAEARGAGAGFGAVADDGGVPARRAAADRRHLDPRDRRAGRLLRRHDMASDIPPDRAAPDRPGHVELSAGADRGRLRRLSHRRPRRRPPGAQAHVPDIRVRAPAPSSGSTCCCRSAMR